ncbi:MAG: mechanosensitive ion channel [Gemmatimonadales bacterium]|nr:mechanosensitive ion channel [Gemmatimonadales bacterium]
MGLLRPGSDHRTGTLTAELVSHRYDSLVWGAVAIVIALVLSTLLRRIVGRLAERRPEEERELARLRRRETALVLLGTAIPYATAIVVLIVLGSTFLPRTAALGGSALLGIIIGFAAQRFLMDIVAGALIAFARWYAIGEFIWVEPSKASGIVEEFGLRTTVVRAFNGDRAYIPNSQIITAFRSPRGFRRYSFEVFTTDAAEARHAIESAGKRAPVGGARFLRPPRVIEERELGDNTWLVRGEVDVAPTMEWLAEDLLVARLKAQLAGDVLLADPIVYTIDEPTLARYERRLLVR